MKFDRRLSGSASGWGLLNESNAPTFFQLVQ